jgi:hypothetical protein
MSDTPETDAKAHSIFGNHSCATVLADFARKLERERDEAIRKQDETNRSSKYACDYHYEEKIKAERERDDLMERCRIALSERDSWRLRADQKYAMRREFEELLGVDHKDASDEQFQKGLDSLKDIIRERDEARDKLADWENAATHIEADHPDEVHCGCVPVLKKLLSDARCERDDLSEILTIIHRWIERNHPDGFIDSLSFTENLERITDRWYDRLDMIERERDEARKKIKRQAERIRELEGATNHAGGLHK